jgi:hypothetical protein
MNGWAFNEFERIWKEAVVVYFKILSLNSFEESHEQPQSGYPMFLPKLGVPHVRNRIA